MRKLVSVLLVIGLLLGGGYLAVSLLGGEVVTLYTRDTEGREYRSSLWIVEDHGRLYLRAGRPGSHWLKRLIEAPEVRLERGGSVREYRAVVEVGQRERVNRLMAERYGWADEAIGLFRDPDAVTPIRLDPLR